MLVCGLQNDSSFNLKSSLCLWEHKTLQPVKTSPKNSCAEHSHVVFCHTLNITLLLNDNMVKMDSENSAQTPLLPLEAIQAAADILLRPHTYKDAALSPQHVYVCVHAEARLKAQ